MRLEEHVGHDHFVFQLGMLAGVARVLMAAGVIPGPAVEAAFLHVGDVVGRQVVAEQVALVGRAPEVAGLGLNRFADAVADAGGVDALAGAVGIEFEHVGAIDFAGIVVGVIHIRARADGDEHLLAVTREHDVARPMAAAVGSAVSPLGRVFTMISAGPRAFKSPLRIGKAHDGIGVADVNVLRIRTRRIEGDSEGPMQAGRRRR